MALSDKEKERLRKSVQKEYDYLSSIGMDGFLWEFVRRNENYIKQYNIYLSGKTYWDGHDYKPPLKKGETDFEWAVRTGTKGKDTPRVYKLLKEFSMAAFICPSKKANDKSFNEYPLYFYFRKPIKGSYIIPWSFCSKANDNLLRSVETLVNENSDDFEGPYLWTCFNLEASNEEILAEIERIVNLEKAYFKKRHVAGENAWGFEPEKEKLKYRARKQQWKDYIIAYDLRKHEIPDLASILFPHEENEYPSYNVNRKIRGYIKNAKQLINGNFKSFFLS